MAAVGQAPQAIRTEPWKNRDLAWPWADCDTTRERPGRNRSRSTRRTNQVQRFFEDPALKDQALDPLPAAYPTLPSVPRVCVPIDP